ncbi:hypothetical protein J6590_021028 [Homalodisca vitripennis]|nr:hypothetical protein J6590_021028 [Homalodisca vitripennis]
MDSCGAWEKVEVASGSEKLFRLREESEDNLATLTVEWKCLLATIEVLKADLKCLKEEMVQLESSQKVESQESADRCTAAALLMAADVRHSTSFLHADHTTTPIEEDYHRSANSSISLPASQTAAGLSLTFLSSFT